MSEVQTAPAPADAPLSIDQLAGVFAEEEKAAAAAPEVEEEPEQDAAPEASAEGEAEQPEEVEAAEAEPEEGAAEEEEPSEKLAPPQSWAKEKHPVWNTLTRAQQEVVAEREADRDRAVSIANQKASESEKLVRSLADKYEVAAKSISTELDRAKQSWTKRWANVDWNAAIDQYGGDQVIKWQNQRDAERQQILAYEDHQKKVAKEAEDTAQLARAVFVKEEAEKLQTAMPELMDPKDGPKRRQAVADYILQSYKSFTPEVVAAISADELIIAEKARRYDESQKAANRQASLPRKNPVSTAKPLPSGSAATGASSSTPARVTAAASARLSKSGRINDLVALFDAEDAAKSRKAQRP